MQSHATMKSKCSLLNLAMSSSLPLIIILMNELLLFYCSFFLFYLLPLFLFVCLSLFFDSLFSIRFSFFVFRFVSFLLFSFFLLLFLTISILQHEFCERDQDSRQCFEIINLHLNPLLSLRPLFENIKNERIINIKKRERKRKRDYLANSTQWCQLLYHYNKISFFSLFFFLLDSFLFLFLSFFFLLYFSLPLSFLASLSFFFSLISIPAQSEDTFVGPEGLRKIRLLLKIFANHQ